MNTRHHHSLSGFCSARHRWPALGHMECPPEPAVEKVPAPCLADKHVRVLDLMWPLHGLTRVIIIGKELGLMDHHDFREAYSVDSSAICFYVVDFSETRRAYDSVVGMLLLLRKHAGSNRERVHLLNLGYDVRRALETVNINVLFTTDTDVLEGSSHVALREEIGKAVSAVRH